MTTFATPGVYIEEITGPGTIAGVGTSTAAFIGPTVTGPVNVPTRVTSWEQFLATFTRPGTPHPHLFVDGRLYHLSLALQGFFTNGGQQAYVVRMDNGVLASRALRNGANQVVGRVTARTYGANATVRIVDPNQQALTMATPSSAVDAAATAAGGAPFVNPPAGSQPVAVVDATGFEKGDRVVDAAATGLVEVLDKQGNWLLLSAPADPALISVRLIPGSTSLRLLEPAEVVQGVVKAGASWDLFVGANPAVTVQVTQVDKDRVHIAAVPAGTAAVPPANQTVTVRPTRLAFATGTAQITGQPTPQQIQVDNAAPFRVGDRVVDASGQRATITAIAGNLVDLDTAIPVALTSLTIAGLDQADSRFRLTNAQGLTPGTLLALSDTAGASTHGVVSTVDANGFVTLADTPARTADISNAGPQAWPVTFAVVVEWPTNRIEVFPDLSTSPTSSRYWLDSVSSTVVTVSGPEPPSHASPDTLVPVADAAAVPLAGEIPGAPATLGPADYQQALDTLRAVDDVNLVCAPDAARLPRDAWIAVERAMIDHCLLQADRIAILDPRPDLPPSGTDSIEVDRREVTSERGFGVLYYPWLQILDPTVGRGAAPRRIAIPPSGHVAGVMARTDNERGVFKAPANTPVAGVLGVERQVTSAEQANLNPEGTNVLRVLPGSSSVIVWGARTTVKTDETDWIYVNVRRLLLMIEESIEQGIRWAVFEPNNETLWKSLDRVIRAFLRTQWRAGALFGTKEDEAFQVRIDRSINPPEERNLGRLHIEIAVAPVRPAEFIIVRIGLFDGGATIQES